MLKLPTAKQQQQPHVEQLAEYHNIIIVVPIIITEVDNDRHPSVWLLRPRNQTHREKEKNSITIVV